MCWMCHGCKWLHWVALSRAHISVKVKQSPCETTFRFAKSKFLIWICIEFHTFINISPLNKPDKDPWIIEINELKNKNICKRNWKREIQRTESYVLIQYKYQTSYYTILSLINSFLEVKCPEPELAVLLLKIFGSKFKVVNDPEKLFSVLLQTRHQKSLIVNTVLTSSVQTQRP